VAVVAHGLDIVYPKSNSALCDNILGGGGLLLSEYVTGSRPDKHRFVERDRIQSGLSKAVFVVQTSVKGGTMHTANFCRDHNRRLYVYYNSQGANSLKGNKRLIEEGALIFGDELENIILDNNMDFSYGSQDSNQSAIEDFE
jgi:DNA processing protein